MNADSAKGFGRITPLDESIGKNPIRNKISLDVPPVAVDELVQMVATSAPPRRRTRSGSGRARGQRGSQRRSKRG
jgi:hypothetical protein